MAYTSVADSPEQYLAKSKNALNRVKTTRKHIPLKLLSFLLPLTLSYLLILVTTDGGFEAYFRQPLEAHLPYDLCSFLFAAAVFFTCRMILYLAQTAAENQVDCAQIEIDAARQGSVPQTVLDTISIQYQKAYYDVVISHARQAHALSFAMTVLGCLVLLIGIIMMLLQLMDPAWLPLLHAVIADVLLLLYNFYYARAMKALREGQTHFARQQNAAQVIKLANEPANARERAALIGKAADYLLGTDSPTRPGDKDEDASAASRKRRQKNADKQKNT